MICDPFGLFDCFDKLYYTQEFVECNKNKPCTQNRTNYLCTYTNMSGTPGSWKPRAGEKRKKLGAKETE